MAGETTPLLPRYNRPSYENPNPRARRRRWIESAVLVFLSIVALVSILTSQTPSDRWFAPPAEPIHVAIIGTLYTLAYNIINVANSCDFVGGGPAGVFAAARLRDLSSKLRRPVLITIFERKHSLGGRLIPDTPIFPFDDSRETPLSAEACSYTSPASDLKDILPAYKSAGWSFQQWKNVEKTL
jgi:NAD(P)-binding Rossmann-like domain